MDNLGISLVKAEMKDCRQIYEMQIESFKDLLDKYQDYDTNPGAEPLEKIEQRMMQEFTDYYLICLDDKKIGAIRILELGDNVFRISGIFILPKYQGKGYAKQVILNVETRYPNAKKWQLDTVKQEIKLRCFYEAMGYKATGEEIKIQDGMTIMEYSKDL